MAKHRKPLPKTSVTAAKFREIAAAIHSYAKIYESLADDMDEAGFEAIPATGLASLEKRSLTELRGNAMKARGTFLRVRDEGLLAGTGPVIQPSSEADYPDKAIDEELDKKFAKKPAPKKRRTKKKKSE